MNKRKGMNLLFAGLLTVMLSGCFSASSHNRAAKPEVAVMDETTTVQMDVDEFKSLK